MFSGFRDPFVYWNFVVSSASRPRTFFSVSALRCFQYGWRKLRPEWAQTFIIGIAVLRDYRLDALGVLDEETETDRRAVVHDIDAVLLNADGIKEVVHHIGQVAEGVLKLAGSRLVAIAESGHVRGDDVVADRQLRYQATIHVGGRGKAVQEHDRGPRGRTRLAVEDVNVAYLLVAVADPRLAAFRVSRRRPNQHDGGSESCECVVHD